MARLNYHHLFYFWQVARVGNLTQVAKTLHIAQSALSKQIRALEDQLGHALFERRGRQLILTSAGREVLNYADDIFQRGRELEQRIAIGLDDHRHHINIGVLTHLSRNFIEGFVAPLLSEPSISLSLTALNVTELLQGLTQQQFDLVLANHTISPEAGGQKWRVMSVSQQALAIVGPPDQVPSTEFPKGYDGFRWVLPSASTAIRMRFDEWCAAGQFMPDIKAESNDMAMLRLLARDSGALAVLPPVVVQDEISQGLLAHYQDIPNVYEHFYAITTAQKTLPEPLQRLLDDAMKNSHF